MSHAEELQIAVIEKMEEKEKEKRTEEYNKGFDDCMNIIKSVFKLEN